MAGPKPKKATPESELFARELEALHSARYAAQQRLVEEFRKAWAERLKRPTKPGPGIFESAGPK